MARLDQAISEALHSAEVAEKLHLGGARVTYLDPAGFRSRIGVETAMFGDIIRRGDIRIQ